MSDTPPPDVVIVVDTVAAGLVAVGTYWFISRSFI